MSSRFECTGNPLHEKAMESVRVTKKRTGLRTIRLMYEISAQKREIGSMLKQGLHRKKSDNITYQLSIKYGNQNDYAQENIRDYLFGSNEPCSTFLP